MSSYAMDIADRFGRFLDLMIRQSGALKMTTLLLLDGDEDLSVMPLGEQTVAALERDRAEGIIDMDDVEALHIAPTTLFEVWRCGRAMVLGSPGARRSEE